MHNVIINITLIIAIFITSKTKTTRKFDFTNIKSKFYSKIYKTTYEMAKHILIYKI